MTENNDDSNSNNPQSPHGRIFIYGKNGKTFLTPKEKQCLIALAELKTTQEIADEMKISTKTVETFVRRVKQKLGVQNRHQLYQIIKDNQLL